MIRVHRVPSPSILTRNSVLWRDTYLTARQTYLANPTTINRRRVVVAENKYNHQQIKAALRLMFSDKCAYCESHITHVDFGDIEHFRPKSLFPQLCFEWDNMLLGCSVCNSPRFKGANFPEATVNGLIVNPVTEDPNDFFSFEFDGETGTANVIDKNPRGETTKNLLGLNRPELIRHRSEVVRKIAYIAIWAKNGDADAMEELVRCCNSDEEFSAFARSLRVHFNL